MAKTSSKSGKKKARVALAVAVVEEPEAAPPAEELEPVTVAPAGGADIDRALDDALPAAASPIGEGDNAAASSPGDNGAAAERGQSPAPAAAEVKELPPHLRKRTGRPGRRTRRELEKEVKELRQFMAERMPGEEPEPAAAPVPVVIDYTEAGEMVGFVLEMIFEAMAEEKGEHWRMNEQKMARAKEHGARFIGPYLPKLGQLLPLMFFCGVVGKHSLAAWRIDKSKPKTPAASPPPAPAAPPPGGIN